MSTTAGQPAAAGSVRSLPLGPLAQQLDATLAPRTDACPRAALSRLLAPFTSGTLLLFFAPAHELSPLCSDLQARVVVPSHGPVHTGLAGLQQTRDWLRWMTALMRESAERGVDLSELLRTPVPPRFAAWAAQPAELHRSLTQWYPRFEQQALQGR